MSDLHDRVVSIFRVLVLLWTEILKLTDHNAWKLMSRHCLASWSVGIDVARWILSGEFVKFKRNHVSYWRNLFSYFELSLFILLMLKTITCFPRQLVKLTLKSKFLMRMWKFSFYVSRLKSRFNMFKELFHKLLSIKTQSYFLTICKVIVYY